jgi:hypothetical protein
VIQFGKSCGSTLLRGGFLVAVFCAQKAMQEINVFFPTQSITISSSDPTTTERGKGREMCVLVHHPPTKTSLSWTLKTRPDM